MGKAARRAGWGVVERLPKTAPKAPFSATLTITGTETYVVISRCHGEPCAAPTGQATMSRYRLPIFGPAQVPAPSLRS
jgi:hypothetical protein